MDSSHAVHDSSRDHVLSPEAREELRVALRDELTDISYPFPEARHYIISDFDVQTVLRIAEDLANGLVYIGAVGTGAHCIMEAVRRVRSAFTRKRPSRPLDDVLLFLIGRHRNDRRGSLVKEIAEATELSEASVRRALRTLESNGIAYRAPMKVGNSCVWYYTP